MQKPFGKSPLQNKIQVDSLLRSSLPFVVGLQMRACSTVFKFGLRVAFKTVKTKIFSFWIEENPCFIFCAEMHNLQFSSERPLEKEGE